VPVALAEPLECEERAEPFMEQADSYAAARAALAE
jgi:hypothetical protein